jgi:hypothetical protein
MNELVLSLPSKLISALRLPSFAGSGLTERMRSTSFALLGLTAAAGLALVAIFAQPGFSLISPAPLPDQPSIGESISNARKVPLNHGPVALVSARPAVAPQRRSEDAGVEAPSGDASSHSSDPVQQGQPAPTGAAAPPPTGGSTPSGGKGAGGSEHGSDASPTPAPTAAPQPAATTPSRPISTPQLSNPKPEAVASAPKPEPAPAPGNSSSAAAAEHASERGIEASTGSGPPAAAATASSATPESSASPGNGNGLAKGLDK